MGFALGETVGPYALLELIGPTVGITTVYKAYQEALDRYVALIVLHSSFRGQQSIVKSFEREVQRAAKLQHPNVLTVYGFYKLEGRPYMVTNFVEGPTLKHLVSLGPLTPAQALAVMQPACDAVGYAHSQGVLHLDVRPTSILLTPEAEIIMTGFGVAGVLMRQKEEETAVTSPAVPGKRTTLLTHLMVKMTRPDNKAPQKVSLSPLALMRAPEYISPEQSLGQEQDERTDVYSLGIVTFESLAGRPPFVGDTPYAVIQEHLLGHTPALSEINPLIPGSITQVVLKAMQRDPDNRYASVAEFMAAFEEAVLENQVAPVPLQLVRQAIVDELIPALSADVSVEEAPVIPLAPEALPDESFPVMSFKDLLDSTIDLPEALAETAKKDVDFADFLDELRELAEAPPLPPLDSLETPPPPSLKAETAEPVVLAPPVSPAPEKAALEIPVPWPSPPPPRQVVQPRKKVAPAKISPKKKIAKRDRPKKKRKTAGNVVGRAIEVILWLSLILFVVGIAASIMFPENAPILKEQFIHLNELITGEKRVEGAEKPAATPVPNSAEWWIAAARAYEQQGDWPSAGEAYWRALERNSTLWDVYVRLGDVLMEQGNAAEAYEQYQIALQQRPQDAELNLKIGRALFYQKQWEQATRYFHKAQEGQPDNALIRAGLARYQLEIGDGATAYQMLETALRLDAELPEALYVLGVYYKLTGQNEYARETFQRVLSSARAGIWVKQEAQREISKLAN